MHELSVAHFLANLLLILVSAKIFGEFAERLGQPAVLGELIGGVFLGFGFFTFFKPNDPVLSLMAEFGVILLLFETGLESDLHRLFKVGKTALGVAFIGMIAPFALGYGVMALLGRASMESVLVGSALTATSIGITARVLSDLKMLGREEAQIILGAAVIDDILGVILLSTLQTMNETGSVSVTTIGLTLVLAIVFMGVALWLGPTVSQHLLRWIQPLRSRGILLTVSISFAFALALLAHAIGSALIVGAFTAGLLLAQTDKKTPIHDGLKPISDIFVPIFFVMVGAHVDLSQYNFMTPHGRTILGLTGLLIVAAIAGKLASSLAVYGRRLQIWGIGVGMIPRGEVGLIFAQIGLSSGLVEAPLYTALVGMVVVTTFITPPLLKKSFSKNA